MPKTRTTKSLGAEEVDLCGEVPRSHGHEDDLHTEAPPPNFKDDEFKPRGPRLPAKMVERSTFRPENLRKLLGQDDDNLQRATAPAALSDDTTGQFVPSKGQLQLPIREPKVG